MKTIIHWRSMLALCATVGCLQNLAADSGKIFEPMTVFELEWASDPQVSPDGRTIAYSRNGYDVMTDRQVSRIWLLAADEGRAEGGGAARGGGAHRPLTDQPGSGPRWSPEGDRIAFVAEADHGREIFMHWLTDNRTAHITRLPETPRGLSFSPDGRWLAFTMFTASTVEPLAKSPTPPEGASWAPAPKVYESVSYRADGRGYLKPGYDHIYVIPADGGSPRQITHGDFNHRTFSWAADNQSLYVSANRRPDWELQPLDSDIYRFAIDSGEVTQITERYGPDNQPAVSPDGRHLAWTGFDDALRGYENAELYVLDLVDNTEAVAPQSLTASLDRSVSSPVWSRDSRSVYVQFDDSGNGAIARVDRNGRIRILTRDLGGTAMSRPYTGGDFHVARNTVAYTRSSPLRPAEIATIDSGKARSLTTLNTDTLDHLTLGEVQAIRLPSRRDGLEIEAWLITPPGFERGRSYPLILEIHGGPFAAYGPHFASELQLFAAAGYVVLYVNPRGSTSYGAGFANEIHHAYPGGDFDDLMSAVDYAIEEGYADEDRLFVTGGSGGGILTAWIITHTDRFRAAVSAKPVINWYSFVLTADMAPFFQRYWFPKPPWEDPEGYLSRSPLHFVGQASTPTMLITGEADHRTPISESEQFYQALKLRGIDAALVRIPEASHGIANRPSHLIRKAELVLAWFERYDTSP